MTAISSPSTAESSSPASSTRTPPPATATWSTSAARRGRSRGAGLATRHCEERRDEATRLPPRTQSGLLRFARNDVQNKKNAGLRRRFVFPECRVRSVEQRVDVVLRGVADVAGELRAVEKLVVIAAGVDLRHDVGLDRVDAAPDFHHGIDVLLDELHRAHDLADALAGQVLEVAGFEDRDDAFLDIVGEPLLLIGRLHLGHRAGRLVDRLGGFEDLLGRLFGTADDRAELAIDLGHFAAVEALAMQCRDLALGAVDGVVDEVELDLQLLALLDLRPVSIEHGTGFGELVGGGGVDRRHGGAAGQRRGALRHLRADRTQLGHDLAMHRRSLLNHFGAGHLADNSLLDTKTFAVNSHQELPPAHSRVYVGRSDLARSSQPELSSRLCATACKRAINHACKAFIENKRGSPNGTAA